MDIVAKRATNKFSAVTYKHIFCLHRGQDASHVGLYNASHDEKSWLERCSWLTHTYTFIQKSHTIYQLHCHRVHHCSSQTVDSCCRQPLITQAPTAVGKTSHHFPAQRQIHTSATGVETNQPSSRPGPAIHIIESPTTHNHTKGLSPNPLLPLNYGTLLLKKG